MLVSIVYFILLVLFMSVSADCVFLLQAPPQADGSVPLYQPLSLAMLSGSEESVMQALSGLMLDKSCIVCSMVVAVQVPTSG